METGTTKSEERWLSGPVAGVDSLLQPVAHALLQANDEIKAALNSFDERKLWDQPEGMASVAFHLQHVAGVLDRMFTYAVGSPLSLLQLKYLSEEGLETDKVRMASLLSNLEGRIHQFVSDLKKINPSALTEARTVGKKRLPTTVIGLLFHAAEHTMRHTGQLLVTARTV